MQVELRQRSFGELVGLTMNLAAAHFGKLVLIHLIVAVPSAIGQYLLESGKATRGAAGLNQMLLGFAVTMLPMFLGPIVQGASILVVAGSFTGKTVTLGDAFHQAMRRFASLLGYGLMTGLLMGLAMLLLIVPGLIVMTWYYLGGAAIVVEGLGATAAMDRSKRLSDGNRWTIFGLAVVMTAVGLAAGYAGGALGSALSPALATLLTSLAFALVGILGVVAPIVAYFNQRVAKEAMDVQVLSSLVDSIGQRTRTDAA